GAAPADQQDGRTEQRDGHQQPGRGEHSARHRQCHQYFNRLASSTEADRRVRYTEMMMARPTTTSAAATTMTKNAMICPLRSPLIRENVTSARLAAFSMSSTHMKTTIALRRRSTPTDPMVNRIADRYR